MSILDIPDILASILRYTDRQSDARCARVNTTWREPALDALWDHVDHLQGLFGLLGPMGALSTTPYTLVRGSINSTYYD